MRFLARRCHWASADKVETRRPERKASWADLTTVGTFSFLQELGSGRPGGPLAQLPQSLPWP
jgi:hypothetical protein